MYFLNILPRTQLNTYLINIKVFLKKNNSLFNKKINHKYTKKLKYDNNYIILNYLFSCGYK